MPAIEQMELDQIAVLWLVSDLVDNYGQNKVQDPVEIPVRWENKRSSSRGDQTQVSAIVASISTDREIPENSVLWLGRVSDYVGSVTQNAKLCEVQSCDAIPDIKNREVRYVVSAVRYKGELPVLEPGTGS